MNKEEATSAVKEAVRVYHVESESFLAATQARLDALDKYELAKADFEVATKVFLAALENAREVLE